MKTVFLCLCMVFLLLSLAPASAVDWNADASPVWKNPNPEACSPCKDNNGDPKGYTYLVLESGDFPQDATWQDEAWQDFATWYSMSSSDRLGNATYTYNCHSYVFRGGSGWLNSPVAFWDNNNTTCWYPAADGPICSNSEHSCFYADFRGKCGKGFLCKQNDRVYNAIVNARRCLRQ